MVKILLLMMDGHFKKSTPMKFNKNIKIANHIIAEGQPVFIIAEAGVNHNGDMKLAKQLIDIAAKAKVNAVKFQTFKTENLILEHVEKAPYQKKTTRKNESQYEMLKKLEVTKEQNKELMRYCQDKGILFLSTPFDEDSLTELVDLNIPAIKVSSTDLTNLLFLKKIAMTGKPIFLSTGMSYLSEVQMALEEIYQHNSDVVLLQCTANYPIDDSEANLNVLYTYQDLFDIIVGYSDHSVGIGASPYAIPMGAKVVEKHFTINKEELGPDHKASLNPSELKEYVKIIRQVEFYLGDYIKKPSIAELKTRKSLQKSLVAACDIDKGEILTDKNLLAKRTGGVGISPIYYHEIIGIKASQSYNKNDIIDE